MRIGGERRRLIVATAVVLAAFGVAASPASAIDYYAEVGGDGPPPCAFLNPCSIYAAAGEATTGSADAVLLRNNGIYTLSAGPGSLIIPAGDTLRPEVPGTRPVIRSTDGTNVLAQNGSVIEDVRLEISALDSNNALELQNGTTNTATRVQVIVSGSNAVGVALYGGAVLRDSMVLNTSPGGIAVAGEAGGGTARNVTAVATGAGSRGFHARNGDQTSTVLNSIFRGALYDLQATDPGPFNVTVEASFSNFVTSLAEGGADIDISGGGNAMTMPSFANAGAGDFHQCPGSPTINVGTTTGISAFDFDGQARNQGGAPDMGADEFDGSACPVPSTATAATETGLRAAALAECKRKAKKKDWSKKRRKRCRSKAELLPL